MLTRVPEEEYAFVSRKEVGGSGKCLEETVGRKGNRGGKGERYEFKRSGRGYEMATNGIVFYVSFHHGVTVTDNFTLPGSHRRL